MMNGQSEEELEENSHFNQEVTQFTSCDLIRRWLMVLQLCHVVFHQVEIRQQRQLKIIFIVSSSDGNSFD